MSEKKKSKFKIWPLCLGIILLILGVLLGDPFQKYWVSTEIIFGMDPYQLYSGIKLLINLLVIILVAFSINKRNILTALIFCFFIVVIISVTIPTYIKFPHRASQSPTRRNLIMICNFQNKYYSANRRYANRLQELDLNRWENDTKHCYYLSDTDIIKPSPKYNCPIPPTQPKSANNLSFQIFAVGNIDNDSTLDVWSIDEKGNLENLVDDVRK